MQVIQILILIQLKAFENNNGNIGKPIKTIASNILILNDINRKIIYLL